MTDKARRQAVHQLRDLLDMGIERKQAFLQVQQDLRRKHTRLRINKATLYRRGGHREGDGSYVPHSLASVLEADESYIGGKRHGKRGLGADGKTPVFGVVERGGRIRAKVLSKARMSYCVGHVDPHCGVSGR